MTRRPTGGWVARAVSRCQGGGRAVPRGDGGSVTAELAVGLPAVVLVLVLALLVAAAGLTQARCADGARAGARAAALGEPPAVAVAAARRVAGADADVTVSTDGEWATVTVRAGVSLGGWSGGPVHARGTATAWVEP